MRWLQEADWAPPTANLLELAELYIEADNDDNDELLPAILTKVGPFQILPEEVDADSIQRGKDLGLPGPVYYYHD